MLSCISDLKSELHAWIELWLLCTQYWIHLFIWGFTSFFNTVQVISQWVVLWAEETSTCSWSRFCTVNCWPLVSNCHLSHIGFGVWTTDLRGGRRVCLTTAPPGPPNTVMEGLHLNICLRWRMWVTHSPPSSEVGGLNPWPDPMQERGKSLTNALQFTMQKSWPTMYWFSLPLKLPVLTWLTMYWKRR